MQLESIYMNKNYIGENIRLYRERVNLTQRELGEKIGKTWEMISRYERGESSPLKQLNTLADALNIDPRELLKDNSINDNYLLNKIPLFISIPKNFNFNKATTYLFYPAPDWILQFDRDTFVIDGNIITNIEEGVERNGYIFLSPNSTINKGDLIMIERNNQLNILKYRGNNRDRIIGRVLAQEVRFI